MPAFIPISWRFVVSVEEGNETILQKKKTEACYFTHIGKPITPAMVVCPVLYTGKYLDTSHESKMEKNF